MITGVHRTHVTKANDNIYKFMKDKSVRLLRGNENNNSIN